MNLNEFSKFYLNNFLDKLTEENKTVLLLGDINYLNYDQHNLTDEFLDSLSFHSFLLQILEPTRVTSNSKTLTDNNFSNTISPNIVSDNLNLSISDDVPQFLIARNIFLTPPKKYWRPRKKLEGNKKHYFTENFKPNISKCHRW